MKASLFFWVGPSIDFRRLIDSLTDDQMRRARFYVVNTLERGEFLDIAKERYADVEVTNYTSLDSVNDPPIYDETRRLAAKMVDVFARKMTALVGDDRSVWRPHLQKAIAINVGDHLYSACRALTYSGQFIDADVEEVVIAERSPRRAWVIRAGFLARGIPATIVTAHLEDHKIAETEEIAAMQELVRLPRLAGRYPSSQIQAHKDLWVGEQTIFISSRLRDDMFVSAVMPVVRELTKDFNVFLYDQQIYVDDPWWSFESYGIHDADSKIFWAWRKINRGITKFRLPRDHVLVQAYEHTMAYTDKLFRTDMTPLKLASREAVLEMMMNSFILTYMSAFEMSTFIEENGDLFVGGIFCPGRILESLVACETLKMLGKPTFDLQSGTISPTKKFFAPTADNLIAIDEFSAEVLNGYHGYPPEQTYVVGSPRLDHHLAPLKAKSEQLMRKEMDLPAQRKIISFMSQPISLAMLEPIIRTLVQAARVMGGDALWLIKPHPREHQAFYDLYQAVIDEMDAQNVRIDRSSSTYPLLKVSDAVVTYCSTAGLEAFALGKPVFAINPLTEPLPYDLVKLGVATECRDAETLAREVAIGLVAPHSNEKYYLQDGKSANRAAEVVRRAIVNPKVRGNGGEPENVAWIRARDLYDDTLAATLDYELVE